MENLIYIITDENGLMQWICANEELAKEYIAKVGNENWTIESEEMC
jgi:hypothetical protein